MKIRVSVTLDIDPEAYTEAYGVERGEIRNDFQNHARLTLLAHFDSIGILL